MEALNRAIGERIIPTEDGGVPVLFTMWALEQLEAADVDITGESVGAPSKLREVLRIAMQAAALRGTDEPALTITDETARNVIDDAGVELVATVIGAAMESARAIVGKEAAAKAADAPDPWIENGPALTGVASV